MTSLVKALKAVAKGNVFVIMVVVRPKSAHAPTGNGDRTSPAMVETKMERSCHACGVTSTGFGTTKRRSKPMAIERVKGMILAPCGLGFDSVIESDGDDDAEMGLKGFEWGVKIEGLKVKRGWELMVVDLSGGRIGVLMCGGDLDLEMRRDRR